MNRRAKRELRRAREMVRLAERDLMLILEALERPGHIMFPGDRMHDVMSAVRAVAARRARRGRG